MARLGITKHEDIRLRQRAFKTIEEVQGALKTRLKKKKKKKGLKSEIKEDPQQFKGGPLTKETVKAMEEANKEKNELIDKLKKGEM